MSAPAPVAGVAHAYEQVRAAIVENRYPPGRRLVEQRIAAELGLSRTPVREALRMLEAEGLVVSERNRGAMVRPLSSTEVEDLYGLLKHLGIERAHVGGLSMGGAATLHFGIRHPEMARSLIVAAAGSGSTNPEEFRANSRAFADDLEGRGASAFEGYGSGVLAVLVA